MIEGREIQSRRDGLRCPHLRHDCDVLTGALLSGRTYAGYAAAVDARRRLGADTQAPAWLREFAGEVVEELRAVAWPVVLSER